MTLHDILTNDTLIMTESSQEFIANAKEQLQKRLHSSFIKINNTLEIDPSYITCAEYQLFIDEKRKSQFYYQPSHWQEFSFPKGEEHLPIVGVSYKDAQAFCKWLNEKYPKYTYYLPQAKFIKQYPIQQDVAVFPWLDSGRIEKGFSKELLNKLKGITETAIPLPIDLDLDHIFDSNHFLILDRVLAQVLELNLDLANDLNLALTRAFDIARDRVLVLDRILSLDRALDLALTRVIDTAPILDQDLGLKIPDKYDKKGWKNTKSTLHGLLEGELITLQKKQAMLFLDITNVMLAYHDKDRLKLRQAYRSYVQRMMVYVYEGVPLLQNKKDKPRWQFWKRGNRINQLKDEQITNDYVEEVEKIAQAFYWQLEIIKLREEGILPAWEGIRLVRKKRFARPLSFY